MSKLLPEKDKLKEREVFSALDCLLLDSANAVEFVIDQIPMNDGKALFSVKAFLSVYQQHFIYRSAFFL